MIKKFWLRQWIFFIILLITASKVYPVDTLAPVSGFAHTFLFNAPIPNAKITVLETGFNTYTNKKGEFGPIFYPIGEPITLLFSKFGYKTTQSATIFVPKGGLTGRYREITFQIPSIETYYLFVKLIGAALDNSHCHVVSTIAAHHKTLSDIPQGEPAARAMLSPRTNPKTFYFDIFRGNPFRGKTNPFTRNLTKTSEDGGIAFFNLPVRKDLYAVSAKKNGVVFSTAFFKCRKDAFINISPPQGPSVMNK